MTTMTYVPARVGEGFFTDFQPPAAGAADAGKAWLWNNATGKFEPANIDTAGTAAAAVAAHVGAPDPHSGYLLASGSRVGAGASRQAFTNGITTGTIRPASDSTTAVQVQQANGTPLLIYDTVNMDVQRAGMPRVESSIVTRGYSLSKLMNLIPNGSGLLSSNYNFSGFVFDAVELHGGAGSFKYVGGYLQVQSDEYIPVDPDKYYRLIAWAKAGNVGGGGYDPANKQYLGIALYDADKLAIEPTHFLRYGSSALTTLAVQLNAGDTTATLTNAADWAASDAQSYNRQFLWWPYTNALGYTYSNYSYSRNRTATLGNYGVNGLWAMGGISGMTIALTQPWPGPTLPAGTPVMNVSAAGTFKYIGMANQSVPNTWTRYEGYIGGSDVDNNGTETEFSPGAAYAKLVFLNNISGAATNVIRYSDIWFSELSVKNLERFDKRGDLVLQSYSSGARPPAGTAGRTIWNSTTGRPNFDTGSAWILADGTAA